MEAEPTALSVERMKVRRQFLDTAASGLKAIASTLIVQARQMPDDAPQTITVGFTVTKKVGNAVIRNRVRRRLRAAAAECAPHAGRPGWNYVVIGRPAALDAPYDIILRDMRYALKKSIRQQAAPAEPRKNA